MVFNEGKRYFVDRRVIDRMSATGSATFASYFARLRSDLQNEVQQFINAFTINETYFYREDQQLRCLTSALLDDRVRSKKRGEPIRIWSVPCSTGEEPFSIAIWILENWPQADSHDIEIVGSDIDTKVLEAAREGIFGKRSLMRLTPELIGKYFVPIDPERWRIVQGLRESILLTPVNLVDASQTRAHGKFDVIFCRNVLIYFDDRSRRQAAENLYENLEPGGYICLGHTESMSRISPLFEICRFADAIVYRKPLGGGHG
jgi:chemotaxis protein methyltransferase CheR